LFCVLPFDRNQKHVPRLYLFSSCFSTGVSVCELPSHPLKKEKEEGRGKRRGGGRRRRMTRGGGGEEE